MEDKSMYIEQVLKIRDNVPLSWHELAKELDLSYNCMKKFVDYDDNTPVRALTFRKIKTLINKYKAESD